MAVELVTDGCSNEVGAGRVETVLHHQVDMAEINVAEIDRDLLAIRRLGAKLAHIVSHSAHPLTISVDGIWALPTRRQASSGRNLQFGKRFGEPAIGCGRSCPPGSQAVNVGVAARSAKDQ